MPDHFIPIPYGEKQENQHAAQEAHPEAVKPKSSRLNDCTPDQVQRYRRRISGPLLDRIDVQAEVPAVRPEDLSRAYAGESSVAERKRVDQARIRMRARQGKENARLDTSETERHCAPDAKGAALLILKLARSIAEFAEMDRVSDAHVAEAIQYRRFDRSPGSAALGATASGVQNPGRQRIQFAVAQLRKGRHRNLAPLARASRANALRDLADSVGLAGVLGRNVLE